MKYHWLTSLSLVLLLSLFTSCVHEWPQIPEGRQVGLTVKHELLWELLEFFPNSRSEYTNPENIDTRYIYEVYREGETEHPISRTVQYSADIDLNEFVTRLEVPVGTYDIYVWNDFVDKNDGHNPLFYDAENFRDVTYLMPYRACSKFKDCFAGKVTITVPESVDEDVTVSGEITVKRPLTAYALIANDYRQFVTQELTRRGLPKVPGANGAYMLPDASQYKVVISYTSFLPNEYSVLSAKPVFSVSGVQYVSTIEALENNDYEAMIAFDMFYINGLKSQVPIQVDVFDPAGENISTYKGEPLPIELSHCTVVKGQFLTQKGGGGVGISPDFDGEINIEIK